MLRKLMVTGLIVTLTGVTYAESMRPLLTLENAFPGENGVEAGALFQYREFEADIGIAGSNDRDEQSVTPYVRYGVLDNLTLIAAVPYRDIDRDVGEDSNGVGDVVIGFQLLAYEDLFEYPYVIPHVELSLDTGDEDEGLGQGENVVSVGLSVGTVVCDKFHYIVDVGYSIYDDRDNIASAAGTFIWDVSEQLSFLVEAGITDEEIGVDKDHPSYYQAGMCYRATEALAINIYGGGTKNTDEDVSTALKASYSF